MSSWHSYSSSFAIGHKALAELLLGPVVVEEKVDGSQFSFGVFGEEIRMRSRKADIFVDPNGSASEKMFQKAVESVLKRQFQLREGWTYRAEYLPKPKAVTLAYGRVPTDHLIGFDVARGEEDYLTYDEKREEFERVGLETVPRLHEGLVTDVGLLKGLLENTSVLGGSQIEGVVVKNYRRFGHDKKFLLGKYVSERFKEIHGAEWKSGNPTGGDVVQQVIARLRTPARWHKAVQHLREAGQLEGSPRDIGALFREVPADVKQECEDEIKDALFKHAWPQISRGVTAGMAQWYKDELLKGQAVLGDHDDYLKASSL